MPKLAIDIEARLASFQDGLNQLNKSAGSVAARMEGAFRGLTAAVAGLGASLSVAGLAGLVKNSIDAADSLNKLSQKVGVSVESLSKLQYAAKLSDVSTEQLGDGLRKLSISLDEVATGGKPAVEAFAKLGISQKQLAGLAPEKAFALIADAIGDIDVASRNNALSTIFGKSFAELVPLLNSGSKGLRAAGDEAERFGNVVSSKTAKAAEEFNDNITRLKASIDGLVVTLTGNIIGPLARFTNELVDASKAAGGFSQALAQLALGQAGNDAGRKLLEVEERIKGIRLEREKLKGTLGDSELARAIPGLSRVKDLEYEESNLLVLRDRLKVLQNIRAERAVADAVPTRKAGKQASAGGGGDAAAAAREAAKAEQELIAKVKERTALDVAAYQDQLKVIEARFKVEEDAQKRIDTAKDKAKAKSAADLAGVLGRTESGKLEEVEKLMLRINDALVAGEINVKQYNEAFSVLEDQTNEILGRVSKPVETMSDEWKKAMKEMQFAVERWGRSFTDTLVEMVMTGKLNFKSLADSIVADLLRMAIQKTITDKIFGGVGSLFGAANGAAFGMGGAVMPFAAGGVVSSPTFFKFAGGTGLMGEAGAEAIMPLKRGSDGKLGVAASGGGGVTIINHIDSRTDRAAVQADIQRGVAMGLARDRDNRRRGRF